MRAMGRAGGACGVGAGSARNPTAGSVYNEGAADGGDAAGGRVVHGSPARRLHSWEAFSGDQHPDRASDARHAEVGRIRIPGGGSLHRSSGRSMAGGTEHGHHRRGACVECRGSPRRIGDAGCTAGQAVPLGCGRSWARPGGVAGGGRSGRGRRLDSRSAPRRCGNRAVRETGTTLRL